MAGVRSVKNQYVGINAHLHSFWQAEHKWNRFHNAYVVSLVQALKGNLLQSEYTAEMEYSLQLRRVGDDPSQPPEAVDHSYSAISIFERNGGEPVAWIELLSPTNKGATKDAATYLTKRQTLLEKGLVFVEIDYLHETPPTSTRLADYSVGEASSHPYSIGVLDPRPAYREGQAVLRQFDVDARIPTMTIPLNAGDSIPFDFGIPYQTLFERAFYGDQIDYSQLPLNFDRYSPADQQRIANRMIAVLRAQQQGRDLEQAPLPAENLPLDEALAEITGANS